LAELLIRNFQKLFASAVDTSVKWAAQPQATGAWRANWNPLV